MNEQIKTCDTCYHCYNKEEGEDGLCLKELNMGGDLKNVRVSLGSTCADWEKIEKKKDDTENCKSEVRESKPPLGLVPSNLYLEIQNDQRIRDIDDAARRFEKYGVPTPKEWKIELKCRMFPKSKAESAGRESLYKAFIESVVTEHGHPDSEVRFEKECEQDVNTIEAIYNLVEGLEGSGGWSGDVERFRRKVLVEILLYKIAVLAVDDTD